MPKSDATTQRMRLALLGRHGMDSLFKELRDQPGLTLYRPKSIDTLIALAERGGVLDAVVIDPEIDDGWPTDVAVEIAKALAPPGVSLTFLCRAAHDAQLIESRVSNLRAQVVLRTKLSGADLLAIVAGDLARRGASVAGRTRGLGGQQR